jgi:hypothetical protein
MEHGKVVFSKETNKWQVRAEAPRKAPPNANKQHSKCMQRDKMEEM